MITPGCRIIENAGPPGRARSEAERRAMFARMRTRHSGSGGAGRAWQSESRVDKALRESNERIDRLFPEPPPLAGGGFASAGKAGLGALLKTPAAKAAITSIAAATGGATVDEYRKKNPTMNPRKERVLAKVQYALGIVAALAGLRAGKGAAKAAAPKLLASADAKLKTAGAAAERLGAAIAAKTPGIIRTPAAKLKAAYDFISKYTGSELPSFANVGDAARFLASGQLAKAAKALTAPALAGATAAGVTGYEEAKIARYQREIEARWKKGEAYDLAPDDQPMPPLLQAIVGSTGNPVEKAAVRLPVGGKFTSALADLAAYQAAWDGIQKARELGTMTPAEADAALGKAADRKPWNMAGAGLYAVQPAAAGFIKYLWGSIADDLATGHKYGTVIDNPERDADTVYVKDAPRIRLLGGDSPEIAHKKGSKDQPWGRESTDKIKSLLPPGSAIRYVAGGPSDQIGPRQKDGFQLDQTDSARPLAYVERIPALVAKIPGVRRYWPGTDINKALIEAGDMQPRYDFMADAHTRRKDYRTAAAEAHAAGRGLYAPDVQKALEKGGLYRWKPTDKDQPPKGEGVTKAMNIGGSGLLISGNSGLFSALGKKAGGAAAQVWNAALAIGGAAQNAATGPKNKGKTYKAPKGYPTGADERRAARRRKAAAP